MLRGEMQKLAWLEDFVQAGPSTNKLIERLIRKGVKKTVVNNLPSDNTAPTMVTPEPLKPIDISNPAHSPNGNANPVPTVAATKAPAQAQTPVPMATQPSQAPAPGIVESTAPTMHSFRTPTGY